jgi:hypothetical protein
MREIRTSGSEGGGTGTTGPPYPYIHAAPRAQDGDKPQTTPATPPTTPGIDIHPFSTGFSRA